MSEYLKTKDMAKHIGYSADYLLNNRGSLFTKGIHFFPKEKRIDWKVSKMVEWVEGGNLSSQA